MRRLFASIAALLLLPLMAPSTAMAVGCAAVEPTQASDNYYELSEPGHVEWIRDDSSRWSLDYRMTADIDLASCVPWTTGIGNNFTVFTGTFDGNNKTLSGLDISADSASLDYVGLFNFAVGATIQDLAIQGSVVAESTGATDIRVGLLGGLVRNSNVSDVSASGFVTATSSDSGMYVGGLIGQCDQSGGASSFSEISVEAQIETDHSTRYSYTGGVCGVINHTLSGATAAGSIEVTERGTALGAFAGGVAGAATGPVSQTTSSSNLRISYSGGFNPVTRAGGLFGQLGSGTALQASASGNVTVVGGSTAYIGGLVGESARAIDNSNASGQVRAESVAQIIAAGGLVGGSTAAISDSLASGAVDVVTSDAVVGTDVGGLVGTTDATITRAYASGDVSVSGVLSGGVVVGGLGGYVGDTVSTAFASGNVGVTATGDPAAVRAGGLLGQLGGGSLRDAYALGDVTVSTGNSTVQAGGLVGNGPGPMTETYAAGAVAATSTGSVQAAGSVPTPTTLVRGFCVSTVAAACSGAASASDQGTLVTTDELHMLELYQNDGWSIAADYSQSVTWGICSNFNRGFAYLTALYSSDPCATSPGSAAPAFAEFVFRLPDGRECSSISPIRVEIGTVYSLPDIEALCRTTPDSRVQGWTIPVAPGFTGAGSPSLPFNPGHDVDVSNSQQFTVVPWEPVLAFRYNANVAAEDSCEANTVTNPDSDGRSNWVWVPRVDVERAPFPSTAACTPPGYVLAAWNTTGDGSGDSYEPGGRLPDSWAVDPTNTRELFAVWERGPS